MSDDRPSILADVLEQLVQTAPDRVRRRLDRDPAIATTWTWKPKAAGFTIAAGNETVSIDSDRIAAPGDVSCTCLLSPHCFHVLACVTTLDVGLADPAESCAAAIESKVQESLREGVRTVKLSLSQIEAARLLRLALGGLLDTGMVSAGVSLQSNLARAAHQCRVQGLHRAATAAIAIGEGVRQLRSRDPAADVQRTSVQIAAGLRVVRHLTMGDRVDRVWIGTARRKQSPIQVKKLFGLFAEPILTQTGYTGAVAYLAGDDGNLYSLSDVKPGDASLCDSVYRGGIEIGSLTQPAHQIVRSNYLVGKITASSDGRLGRGKQSSVVRQAESDWNENEIKQRFEVPLGQQLERMSPFASMPETDRPAGWDLLFLKATVVGGRRAQLVVTTSNQDTLELAIAIDDERLPFRHNLRLLCHASGLRLQIIARADQGNRDRVFLLAIRPINGDPDGLAELELPENAKRLVCFGLDRLDRNMIVNGSPQPKMLEPEPTTRVVPRELEILRRRWISSAMMGCETSSRLATRSSAREVTSLAKAGFECGAALLDALLRTGTDKHSLFIAIDEYLNACRRC